MDYRGNSHNRTHAECHARKVAAAGARKHARTQRGDRGQLAALDGRPGRSERERARLQKRLTKGG